MKKNVYDIVIAGGGFYGCSLALYLVGKGYSVLLVEKEEQLMQRASAINQARVHAGFHYPRSLATAIRSLMHFPRFALEFRQAIDDSFIMLYAIARQGSKVNAKRFYKIFKEVKAPIWEASPSQKALFAPALIEEVFAVKEYAFNHAVVRQILANRLDSCNVETSLGNEVIRCTQENDLLAVSTSKGTVRARNLFNCTYSRINLMLENSNEPHVALKHEITEMVLVEPPKILDRLAVTVMDGPFFSLMPYPAEEKYTLSHVRYTPHCSWQDTAPCPDAHKILHEYSKKSNFLYMCRDAQRFMPGLTLSRHESLFEVKTVLIKNELDDGRPIFYRKHKEKGNLHTVMGSKIDNVYDLFESLHDITRVFSAD